MIRFLPRSANAFAVSSPMPERLKDTGMPIKEIRHYAELRAAGDSTLSERMEMLVQHRFPVFDWLWRRLFSF